MPAGTSAHGGHKTDLVANLNESTSRLEASLDVLARRHGNEPLPVAVAVAAQDLTDEQRLAVARELKQRGVVCAELRMYEVEARARLAGRPR